MSISTVGLEIFNGTTHMKLNKVYADVDDEDGTNRFQEMCLIMSADSEKIFRYLGRLEE